MDRLGPRQTQIVHRATQGIGAPSTGWRSWSRRIWRTSRCTRWANRCWSRSTTSGCRSPSPLPCSRTSWAALRITAGTDGSTFLGSVLNIHCPSMSVSATCRPELTLGVRRSSLQPQSRRPDRRGRGRPSGVSVSPASGDRSAWRHPLGSQREQLRQGVEVRVVVQQRHLVLFGQDRDEQVRHADLAVT